MEVQESRAEGQEVWQIAQVFGEDDPTMRCENPVKLLEEGVARFGLANLMRRQQKRYEIGGIVFDIELSEIGALRNMSRRAVSPRPRDRRLAHLGFVEDVEHAQLRVWEKLCKHIARIIKARVNVQQRTHRCRRKRRDPIPVT